MKRLIRGPLGALLAAALLLAAQPVMAGDSPVNINAASAEELTTVKGIGPAKARAIVDYREKNGTFESVDDLTLVRGIGDKMLEQLRPHLTVGAEGGGAAASAKGQEQ